jgi:glycosyltransferase involved in cell wall biosynthesis
MATMLSSKKLIRVFDCSNSVRRPHHRGGGGPIINDAMRYLRENSHEYGCVWCDTPANADVIITNDVFPDECLALDRPKLKRMDGIFWQEQFRDRNRPLNKAARQADHVIFISEFSKQSYFNLYGEALKSVSVALNWVDPKVFFPRDVQKFDKFTFVAVATDWSRKEKRLSSLIKLANLINDNIIIIGKCSETLPKNVFSVGYIADHHHTATILSKAHAFLNLSYKDAAPKVVAQGISCGLPVLYANSGGVPEIASHGDSFGIPDNTDFKFEGSTPELSKTSLLRAYTLFRKNRKGPSPQNPQKNMFASMLSNYFRAIHEVTKG